MKISPAGVRALKGFVIGLLTLFLCVGALAATLKVPITDLIATVVSAVNIPPVLVFFTPYTDSETLMVGDTATFDFDINARIPINSMGVSIVYPPDSLEVVGFSKQHSFLDLWTEDTTLKEGSGELDFSGGTTHPGGVTGTSTALTLTVRAKKAGSATVSVGTVQVFAADGKGTELDSASRSLTFTIEPQTVATQGSGSGGAIATARPTPPSPDLNGDGTVSVLDASILIAHMLMPYDPRYDLNMDGIVGLSDFSVLVSSIKNL